MTNLDTYTILTEQELTSIDGGVAPLIVIGGIAITKGAAIAGGLFTAGVGIGYAFTK